MYKIPLFLTISLVSSVAFGASSFLEIYVAGGYAAGGAEITSAGVAKFQSVEAGSFTGSSFGGVNVNAGTEDTTRGTVVAFGDSDTAGGILAFENGANADGTVNQWRLFANTDGTMVLRALDGGGSTVVTPMVVQTDGDLVLGATLYGIFTELGTEDTTQAGLKIYGGSSNVAPYIDLYTSADYDGTVNRYRIRGGDNSDGDFQIIAISPGGTTLGTALEYTTAQELNLDGARWGINDASGYTRLNLRSAANTFGSFHQAMGWSESVLWGGNVYPPVEGTTPTTATNWKYSANSTYGFATVFRGDTGVLTFNMVPEGGGAAADTAIASWSTPLTLQNDDVTVGDDIFATGDVDAGGALYVGANNQYIEDASGVIRIGGYSSGAGRFYRASNTVGASIQWLLEGLSSTSAKVIYGGLISQIQDNTNGSEDAYTSIRATRAGAQTEFIRADGLNNYVQILNSANFFTYGHSFFGDSSGDINTFTGRLVVRDVNDADMVNVPGTTGEVVRNTADSPDTAWFCTVGSGTNATWAQLDGGAFTPGTAVGDTATPGFWDDSGARGDFVTLNTLVQALIDSLRAAGIIAT